MQWKVQIKLMEKLDPLDAKQYLFQQWKKLLNFMILYGQIKSL